MKRFCDRLFFIIDYLVMFMANVIFTAVVSAMTFTHPYWTGLAGWPLLILSVYNFYEDIRSDLRKLKQKRAENVA